MLMLRIVAIVIFPLFVWCEAPWAQSPTPCRNPRINALGTNGQPITVAETATPIVARFGGRCGFTIVNENGNPMRCSATSGDFPLVPTAQAGILIPGTVYPVFGWIGQQAWSCIRTTGSSAVISVLEEMP